MVTLLLATLLHLLRLDYSPDILSLDDHRQSQIVEEILSASTQPLYHITRALGPLKQSPFVQPAEALSAEAGILIDELSGQVLWQRNTEIVLPIASLTKLATAIVFLETNPDFTKEVTIEKSDGIEADGSRLAVAAGETLTVGDLFYASLVGSANNATKAMVRSTELSTEEFVRRMNEKARQLGLPRTTFHEVTGLDPDNTSTVQDYSRLASYAFRNERIHEALNRTDYVFSTLNTRHSHRLKNTNQLLADSELHLIGAKTGYLDEAGFTFVAEAEKDGHRLIVVLFKSDSSQARFAEAKGLLQWAFAVHQWL